MSAGWVYVLSNPGHDGKVKVGYSVDPDRRCDELYTTGVLKPFKIETAFLFGKNADRIEKKTHRLLSKTRESKDREFFNCTPHFAAEKILEAAEIVGEEVRHTDPELPTEEDIPATEEDIPATGEWVYVISNRRMIAQGIVAIGWTGIHLPENVAKGLSYDRDAPLKIETAFLFSKNAERIKISAHELLSKSVHDVKPIGRLGAGYGCTPHWAGSMILKAAEQIGEPVRDNDPILPPIHQDHGDPRILRIIPRDPDN